MTELETLERAKVYIEKLANGINPIDGTAIPDDDVVNNVRLSRCFFYVADVLRQVIDNGGISPQKKPSKLPFSLSLEKRKFFDFSEKPIPISEISKRINMLTDNEHMKSLSYDSIRDWLVFLGMLESVQTKEDQYVLHPTQQGKDIGIMLENRVGQNGSYVVVVYTIEAQHFILDNLDAICEYEKVNKENQGQRWSHEHDTCLVDLFQKGVPIDEIAITLKRNSSAIRKRLHKLGMIG